MTSAEIKAKFVELALIYQDESQGKDSDAAKKLLAELAENDKKLVEKAGGEISKDIIWKKISNVKSGMVNTVLKDINAVRDSANPVAPQPTKPQNTTDKTSPKRTTKDITELGSLLKEVENQPATPKVKPVRKKVNPSTQPTKPDTSAAKKGEPKVTPDKASDENEMMRAVDDFIYGKTDDSKKIEDFADKKENCLKVLGHLTEEFSRIPKGDEPRVNRKKLFQLAVGISAKIIEDKDVEKSLTLLLNKMSEVARRDYKRFEQQKKNPRDNFIVYVYSIDDNRMDAFLKKINKNHAVLLCKSLDEEAETKYKEWIAKYTAEVEEKKKQQNEQDREPKNNNTGDKEMTEENSTPKTEENTFTPSAVQIRACEIAGITDIKKFKSKEELLAALEGKCRIDGDKIYKIDGKEEMLVEEVKGNKNNEGNTSEQDKTKPNAININGEGSGHNTEQTEEDRRWIEKKIKDYQDMAAGRLEGCPKLADYKHDDTITEGFAASFNGGKIHYTNRDNVTVSKESGLTVFEALVTEPDNKGRAVNFGPNLEHKQAVMLFAACVLHGNPMGNNKPNLSQADFDMLKDEFQRQNRAEDWNNFAAKVQEMLGGKNENVQQSDANNFDDETKGKVKEALDRQYKLSALESKDVVEKDKEGKIVDGDDGKPKKSNSASDEDYKEYIDLKSKQANDKTLLTKMFIDNPEEVRAIMRELINEKTSKADENVTSFKARRHIVEAKMGLKNDKVNAKNRDLVKPRREQLQEDMKIALGIIPEKDGKKKADDVEKYIKENNITTSTYFNLGGDKMKVAEFCSPSIKDMQAALGIVEPSEAQTKYGVKPLEGDALKDYIKDNNITAYKYALWGGKDENKADLCEGGKDQFAIAIEKMNKLQNDSGGNGR